MHSFDLVIVGGGLVGASLAIALESSSLKVALIDARLPQQDDPRLFALNDGSCQFLKKLDVWHGIEQHAAAIREVHISHAGCFGVSRLKSEELGLSALGFVVPAYIIETILYNKLAKLSNVTLFRPAKLIALQENPNDVQLTFTMHNQSHLLTAKAVVGADGVDSTVRTLMGFDIEQFDYAQSALVTRTVLDRSHQQVAYERFNQQNTIAMLPLPGNECATIWSGDNKLINHLISLPDEKFLNELQSVFGNRLGKFKAIKRRVTFPLRMVKALQAATQRVYLLGNAAHTLHPVAAQGFNLALYEVASLVETIDKYLMSGSLFENISLKECHLECISHQAISIRLSHMIARYLPTRSLILRSMMGLGLVAMDCMPLFKRRLMERMTGRVGTMPRLLLEVNKYES